MGTASDLKIGTKVIVLRTPARENPNPSRYEGAVIGRRSPGMKPTPDGHVLVRWSNKATMFLPRSDVKVYEG